MSYFDIYEADRPVDNNHSVVNDPYPLTNGAKLVPGWGWAVDGKCYMLVQGI